MITKKCLQCGKDFTVHNYRKDTALYCSISCSKKGQIAWNKTNIIKECLCCGEKFKTIKSQNGKYCSHKCYWKSLLGIHKENSGQFKKGNIPPLVSNPELIKRGKDHPRFKGYPFGENHKIRTSLEYKLWVKACMERDNFTCQKTGQRGGDLQVHHINNFADYPELRTSIENGITLSKQSHREFHKIYGVKNNTKEQLIEFLNLTN